MKKYLMSLAAVALVGSAFVSCSKSEDVFSVTDQLKNQKQAYTQAFVARYGQPAANHTWGFGTTRANVNVNGNLWVERPVVTAAEKAMVYAHVNKDKADVVGATEEFPENLVNYWVTQVWTGTDTYTSADGGDPYVGSTKMNNLHIAETASATITNGELSDGWYHVNNFNRGDNTDWSGNTLISESGTFDFAYHNAEDSKYHNKWIAVPGASIDASLAGYYYICFDFEATNDGYTVFRFQYPGNNPGEWVETTVNVDGEWTIEKAIAQNLEVTYYTTVWDAEAGANVNVPHTVIVGGEGTRNWSIDNVVGGNMMVSGDDNYTDWIIRLVYAQPAEEEEEVTYTDRVICEDLGTADDFDFNDVAFDIRYADGGAYVKVISVGGIYPLTVAGHEVHQLCGQQADAKGFYRIAGEVDLEEFFVSGATTAADIDIYVTYIDGTADSGSATFELRADAGQVPQKIKVTPSYKLCSERQNIEAKYPLFKNYVQDQTVEWY